MRVGLHGRTHKQPVTDYSVTSLIRISAVTYNKKILRSMFVGPLRLCASALNAVAVALLLQLLALRVSALFASLR